MSSVRLNPRVPQPPESVFQARHGAAPGSGPGSANTSLCSYPARSGRSKSVPPVVSRASSTAGRPSAAADLALSARLKREVSVRSPVPLAGRLSPASPKGLRPRARSPETLPPSKGMSVASTTAARLRNASKQLRLLDNTSVPRQASAAGPPPYRPPDDAGSSQRSSYSVSPPPAERAQYPAMPLPLAILQGTAAAATAAQANSSVPPPRPPTKRNIKERIVTPRGSSPSPGPNTPTHATTATRKAAMSPRLTAAGRQASRVVPLAPPPPPPSAVRIRRKPPGPAAPAAPTRAASPPTRAAAKPPARRPKAGSTRSLWPFAISLVKEGKTLPTRRSSQSMSGASGLSTARTATSTTPSVGLHTSLSISKPPVSPSGQPSPRPPTGKRPKADQKKDGGSPGNATTPPRRTVPRPKPAELLDLNALPSSMEGKPGSPMSPSLAIVNAAVAQARAQSQSLLGMSLGDSAVLPDVDMVLAEESVVISAEMDTSLRGRRSEYAELYDTTKLYGLTPLVIDNGSATLKAGTAANEAPTCVFATLVGRPKKQRDILEAAASKDTFIGDAAQQRRGVLALTWPIENGAVTNWDDMELVWEHLFTNELRVNPAHHPVLLTDVPQNEDRCRLLMAEIMFETFQVPALYISDTATLSTIATGPTTGLALTSGHGATFAVPVYEGCSLTHAVTRLPVAGCQLTEYMARLLRESSMPCNASGLDVSMLKAAVCYVARNFEAEEKKPREELTMEYALPDGNTVEIGDARFRCMEALFRPELLGLGPLGLHMGVLEAVRRCDEDLHYSMLSRVVLSGGNTLYPGFDKRLSAELKPRVPLFNVHVVARPERLYLPWIGGAVVASQPTMISRWIVDEEYRELGPGIVPRKCV